MTIRLALIIGLFTGLCCVAAQAQNYQPFPGSISNQRIIRIQERVNELYTAENYQRALFLYEKELAPRGDKYAQYMVGYMYLNAQSVQADKSRALAWYRLSAERDASVLQRAQQELINSMTADEIMRSNRIFGGLWDSVGDYSLIMKLVRQDINTLKSRTGSRIPSAMSVGPTLIIRPSGETVGPNFYRDIRARLEMRLTYIEAWVEIGDVSAPIGDELMRSDVEEAREAFKLLEQR